MPRKQNAPRAIDMYSGVGGWSLGLHLAGVEVLQSYEWWDKANSTNHANNRHSTVQQDIRTLSLDAIPSDIDIVVGSPPCTQFSFSNRGGSGDLADGLVDIAKFFEVVARVRPKYWAMENVPRVAEIVRVELKPGGSLYRFRELRPSINVFDICEWGVPQRRKRCVIGSFDIDRLLSYRAVATPTTLGDVIRELAADPARDPIYGLRTPQRLLIDHEPEDSLSSEESRMNREMKTFHPVYNNMPFPDPMDRPARTVTAVCTRVSRESIVVSRPGRRGEYRRLTLRERACLQGFPIQYQFYGDTFPQKLRMIGNAIPPPFTYYIASAMQGVPASKLPPLSVAIKRFTPPSAPPRPTPPETVGQSYPADRRFRAALPHLRFKSGVRFEFGNSFVGDKPSWEARFFFGNSKNITAVVLDNALSKRAQAGPRFRAVVKRAVAAVNRIGTAIRPTDLQRRWSHDSTKGPHPYEIVDDLGAITEMLISTMGEASDYCEMEVARILGAYENRHGFDKVLRNAVPVLAGLIVCSAFNSSRARRSTRKQCA